MWDIVPQNNITEAYKVRLFCIREVDTLTRLLLALLCVCLGVQSTYVPCKNLRLPFLAANFPVYRVPIYHVYHDRAKFCYWDHMDTC
jgi:hypothetical protein